MQFVLRESRPGLPKPLVVVCVSRSVLAAMFVLAGILLLFHHFELPLRIDPLISADDVDHVLDVRSIPPQALVQGSLPVEENVKSI
jgi:hypothetical protein